MDPQSLQPTGNQFQFKSEVYTGPLDLLIELIERRKLLVNDISLASVTDDYMKYVGELEERSLRDIADFIVLAATLLLLKSKSLLPVLELTEAEEESVDILEKRLRFYQIFRNAGKVLGNLFGAERMYGRPYVPDQTPHFTPDKYVKCDVLRAAIGAVIQNLPKKIEKPKVNVRKVVSLEEMIDTLRVRIERQLRFTFKDFTGNAEERSTIIVGFLAVLEMVKQEMIRVTQHTHFNEIEIERNASSTPHYS